MRSGQSLPSLLESLALLRDLYRLKNSLSLYLICGKQREALPGLYNRPCASLIQQKYCQGQPIFSVFLQSKTNNNAKAMWIQPKAPVL